MKYNVVISRTYATEIVVEADNQDGVYEWLGDNDDKVNHEELEQCNIIDTYTSIEAVTPSPNEAVELQSLSVYIQRLIQEYRHVEDFVPKELHDALAKMMLADED
jgi:hypothetical protein